MRKSVIFLMGAIVLALTVWIFEAVRVRKADISNKPLFDISPDQISRIEVKHLINGIVLEKRSHTWFVKNLETEMGQNLKNSTREIDWNEYNADDETINEVVKKLNETNATAVVSRNPDKRHLYQVGKLAKKVSLFNSNEKLISKFFIGRSGSDPFTSFLRVGDSNNVYLVDKNLSAMISADLLSWRDKTIWKIRPDSINMVDVTFSNGKESYTLGRVDQNKWYIKRPREINADSSKVRAFLSGVSDIDASRFAHKLDLKKAGLDDPRIVLTLHDTEGNNYTLLIGDKNKQGYIYARRGEKENIYLLPSSFISKIPDNWKRFKITSEDGLKSKK